MLAVAAVERGDEVEPVLLAVGDLVEDLFHLGGEADVDVVGEVLAQQAGHRKRGEARHQRLALPRDVAAALDGGHGRRVGGRPADAFFLQPLHQRRFGVAGRRRGVVALGGERREIQGLVEPVGRVHLVAHGELRQQRLLLAELGRRIVAALDIGAQVAGELDRLAAGREDRAPAVGRPAFDLDRGAQQLGVGHLRGDGALPDQLVELQLVALEHALERLRRAAEVGRADRLVRFLGVAHLGLVLPRPLVVVVRRTSRARPGRPRPAPCR